jgi:beta-phosphoglucomutase-like phosphatase (HAD superfamily)
VAAERLGIEPARGLAVEDSVNGARSAVAAGHPTVGILQFVPAEARDARVRDLTEAGVVAVVEHWSQLVGLLAG